ncbi:hypothetical protein [Actinoplanes sp. NPDC051859]|uniref:hypothetical protein n=1 Tax=Actinoplanes sp. NPDC051859 TaxID=3363909 RepID=UPI003789CA6D
MGEVVTVRARWPMPGIADGAAVTVRWGPYLAAMVAAGRYELLPTPLAPHDDGSHPAGPADQPSTGDGGQGSDAAADGARPGRGPRRR